MFISKSEKLQINERLGEFAASMQQDRMEINERFEGIVSSLVKVSEQQDKSQDGIPNIKKTIKSLTDNISNLDSKIDNLNAKIVNFHSTVTLVTQMAEQSRTMRMRISELEMANKTFAKNYQSLSSGIAALAKRKTTIQPPKKIVIPPESVQALKESGVWDDPIKRVGFIDQLIKEEPKKRVEAQKERQRQYSRNYYLRKKAERLAEEIV